MTQEEKRDNIALQSQTAEKKKRKPSARLVRNMFDMENILPPLYVLDKHNIVIHAGSIAYPYAFGLGIGWIIAPDYLLNRLAVVSMETNHYPSQINHLITSVMLSENVNGGGIYRQIKQRKSSRKTPKMGLLKIKEGW